MPSGMLPRSPASRRGRSPTPSTSRRLPRLSTSTAGEATKKSDNGDKKACAAQRAAQGCHLHLQGYQGCQQVQQERLQRSPTTATRRLVLPRELPMDPSTSTRLPRLLTSTAGEATKKSENGDKKTRAAQRAAQGCHLHGLPRLSTSTAGEATKKSDNSDKKARAAQRGAQ